MVVECLILATLSSAVAPLQHMPVVAAAQAALRIQVGLEPVGMAAPETLVPAGIELVPVGIELVPVGIELEGTVGRSHAD